MLFYDNIGQDEVCLFLLELLRHLSGPMIVLPGNSATHKSGPIEQLRRRHPRLRIENFLAYAPELNPDEAVWSQAKRELANSCPRDLEELVDDLLRSIDRIRSSREKLRGRMLQSDLPSFLR